jgi:hypothetical protein
MAAVFKGNDYLPLKFASVSFYCQVSDTGSFIVKQNLTDIFKTGLTKLRTLLGENFMAYLTRGSAH